jgi:adenine/guanine phosphoribosyltransferase-like PRPP-binding protein
MRPEDYWQDFVSSAEADGSFFPARLDDGRILRLPIRYLPDGKHALASLIINQASFAVVDALAADLAAKLAHFKPDIVVGLPTLGLTLAAAVAAKLGHARYLPLGVSKKFWYREDLSVPLSSITTPDQAKRLYIDPRMVPLLDGKRMLLVDDVISSGVSMAAGLELLAVLKVRPVALGAAMLQTERWQARLGSNWVAKTVAVFRSPLIDLVKKSASTAP